MSELELPSLQLGRYLELLQRRRWQLLPAALIGLLIGLFVAWMIPRYYVARTLVRLHPALLADSPSGPRQDPFVKEVSKARHTISDFNLVDEVVRSLGWDDFYALRNDSIDKYRGRIWEVISRITVLDLDSGEGRSSAMLAILFRDQDPIRAADFANRIRDLYLKRETEFVRQRAWSERERLQDEVAARFNEYEQALADMRRWYETSGLDPFARTIDGKPLYAIRKEEWARLGTKLAELETGIRSRKAEIEDLERRLAKIPKERTKTPSVNDPALLALIGADLAELQVLERKIRDWRPSHPSYAAALARKKVLEARIKKAMKAPAGQALVKEPNPLWIETNKKLAELKGVQKADETRLEGWRKTYKELSEYVSAMPSARESAERLESLVTQSRKAWESARRLLQNQDDLCGRLEKTSAIIEVVTNAEPPPAPTYPNRWLVALLGSGIGLASAIGLIFLFDLMQATWKTLEEVQRGLPVPALGGVSHLELPEEAEAARKRRMRITAVTAAALFLMAALIGVYFLDPVRLPDWARGALDALFGHGG